jgi:hypothetical protein
MGEVNKMTDQQLLSIYFKASSNGRDPDERTANGLRAVYEEGRQGLREENAALRSALRRLADDAMATADNLARIATDIQGRK